MSEWIDPGSPRMLDGCLSPPSGRAVKILPRRREPIEKRGEVLAGARRRLAVAVREGRQLVLHIPDMLEQRDRIERFELLAECFFEALVDQGRSE